MKAVAKYFGFSLILFLGTIFPQGSFYYTHDLYGKYVEYLINSGSITLDYPLIKPYTIYDLHSGHVRDRSQDQLSSFLFDDLDSYTLKVEKNPSGIIRGEVDLNLETGTITQSRNSFNASINYPVGNFALRTSFNFDQRFKDDTTYFGELGEWYYGRFDESYISYSDTSSGLNFAYGRVPRNLGSYASPSLILSDHPYSYDHLWLQYKNNLFSFSFMTSRLEDKYGFDNRYADSSTYGWYKRFYALHRLDLNIADNFKLAFTEAVLYGGKNQQWLSYYMNPLVPFYISKNNQRSSTDEGNANIYLALDLWYKPIKNVTLFSQIFIDDIDFKSENRSKFPERKAFFGSATVTDLVISSSQYGLAYTWVENWTYTSFYTWANYNIHQRSIGFPYNSFQKFELFFDYFGIQQMILSGKVSYSEKGDNSLNNSFGATFEKFPMGVVEKTFELNVDAQYFFRWNWVLTGEIEVDFIQNQEHIAYKRADVFHGYLELNFVF